jgi:hypothetical protein
MGFIYEVMTTSFGNGFTVLSKQVAKIAVDVDEGAIGHPAGIIAIGLHNQRVTTGNSDEEKRFSTQPFYHKYFTRQSWMIWIKFQVFGSNP